MDIEIWGAGDPEEDLFVLMLNPKDVRSVLSGELDLKFELMCKIVDEG